MDAPGGLPSPWLTLVLQLNALYATPGEPGALVEAAAEAVRSACDALEVAVFWVGSGSERSRTRAERLRHAGSARAAHVPADASLQRRLRAAALSALAHRSVRVGRAKSRLGADPEDAAVLLAMPFGQPEPYAVLALCAPSDRYQGAAEVLARAHDALATALRLAHSERELMRSYRQHAQMRAIFSHSSEAIIAVDRRFQIVEANPAFASLLDVAGERAVGKLCSDVLMCQNERGDLLCGTPDCPLAQAFENTHSAPYRELLWQSARGKRKFVSASFAVIPSPAGQRGLIIARDATPLKAADRMRAHFISMVSHELRTPLNSVNGFLEIVLEGQAGKLTPRQAEFLSYARTSTHELMRLVEDIVFISRADTGQFHLRLAIVAVPEVVSQVMQNYRAAASAAQVELVKDLDADLPGFCADELRIQQVLSNLVSNAIKFTPPQGRVVVRAIQEADSLRLAVSDTGAGISLADQDRIFERFYQAETGPQSKAGGYGLGLAIAKLIVEQHGGRIGVESQPGEGSSFYFTIPLRASDAPCPPEVAD